MAALGTHGVFVNNRSPQTYGLHWGRVVYAGSEGDGPHINRGCWASQ